MKTIADTNKKLKVLQGQMKWSCWEGRGDKLLRASEACEEILAETSGDAAKRIKQAIKVLEGAIEVCEAELSKLGEY